MYNLKKSSYSNLNVRVNLLVWIGLTLLVAICATVRKWPTYSLLKHCAIVQGHVSQKLPNEHQSFYFIYEVEHKIYTSIGKLNSDFSKIQVGDPVTVYYDKRQPENCTFAQPKIDLVQAVGLIVAQFAIIPLIAMIFLHRLQILPPWDLFSKIRPASRR
jgi:hypothetical protein